MKNIKTWLPIFPGFYGTIFEPCEDSEIEYVNSERELLGKEPLTDNGQFEYDYESYRENMAKSCVDSIEKELKEGGFISSMKFEFIFSPKEYNFYNDSINIEVDLSEENINNIRKFLSDDLYNFSEYVRKEYAACDEYYPIHSNNSNDWINNLRESLNDLHKLGSILNFICERYIQQDDLNMWLFDNIVDIHLECTNTEELIKS